ncbi:MAG: CDP-alcohol phosphatidyltransferase family protein [Inquilinaceae bacterium]
MLDRTMRKLIDRPLHRAAGHLARAGIAANGVTVAGFAVGGGALLALAACQYPLALALILVNRLADGLDGALARRQGVTDLGGYLDIVFDFIFYSGMVFGFALGRPDMAIPAAFLMFSFVGTGTAFLAYAVIAAKRGLTTDMSGPKSLYYVGGLTEGTETIAVLIAICLFPDAFAWIAYGFGILCWITTAGRVDAARRTFR